MPTFIKQRLCCSLIKRKDDIEASQQGNNSHSVDDCELPDRMLHPKEYEEETNTKHRETSNKASTNS